MPKPLFDYSNFIQQQAAAAGVEMRQIDAAIDVAKKAADLNITTFQDISKQISADLSPFIQAGQQSTRQLQSLLGLHGQARQQEATQSILQSPQVQQEIETGTRAIGTSAAARGLLGTGRFLTDLQKFGQELAVSEIGRNQQQLFNLAGIGLQAAGARGGLEATLGQSIAGERRFAATTEGEGLIAKGRIEADLARTVGRVELQKQLDPFLFLMGQGGLGGSAAQQPQREGQAPSIARVRHGDSGFSSGVISGGAPTVFGGGFF